MLDFGSRMSKDSDHGEDDLFSSVSEPSVQSESCDNEPDFPAVEAQPETVVPVKNEMPGSVETPEVKKSPEPKAPVRFSFLRKAQNRDNDELEKVDTCKILRNARIEQGMSLEQVEAETQIRGKYLEALENGEFDDLPQQVYVLAYLRKLCRLYGISAQDEDALVQPWREVSREVPENLPASMIPDEDSENSKILRRVEFGLLAGGAIIVIGIVALLVILAVSFFRGDTKVVPEFDNSELLNLQEKPQLSHPEAAPVRSER